jgi:SulP family sulfate permease
MLGEMGLYRHASRSASVVAEEDTTVYVFDRDALEQLERESPPLALAFHAWIVKTLSDRLSFENTLLSVLHR